MKKIEFIKKIDKQVKDYITNNPTDVTSDSYIPYDSSMSAEQYIMINVNNIVYIHDALLASDVPNFFVLVKQVVTNTTSIGPMGNLQTSAQDNLVNAINELHLEQEAPRTSTLNNDSVNVPSGGINPLLIQIDTNKADIATNVTNIDRNYTDIGDVTTLKTVTKTDTVAAINEEYTIVHANADAVKVNEASLGDLTELTTDYKTDIVGSINEVVTDVTANTNQIHINNTDITTNKNGIATNVTAIATNKTNIDSNDVDITNINSKLSAIESAIVDQFQVEGTYNSSGGTANSAVEFIPTMTETIALDSAYITFSSPNKFTTVQKGNFEAFIMGQAKVTGVDKTLECRLYKNSTLIQTKTFNVIADASSSVGFSVKANSLAEGDVMDIRFYFAEAGTIDSLGVVYDIGFSTVTTEGVTSSSKLINNSATDPSSGINPQLIKADKSALDIGDFSAVTAIDPTWTDISVTFGAFAQLINTNVTDIATNVTDIATNKTDIATVNTTFIINPSNSTYKQFEVSEDTDGMINFSLISGVNWNISFDGTGIYYKPTTSSTSYNLQWGNHADNIGDLSDLNTDTQESLVAAINEHENQIENLSLSGGSNWILGDGVAHGYLDYQQIYKYGTLNWTSAAGHVLVGLTVRSEEIKTLDTDNVQSIYKPSSFWQPQIDSAINLANTNATAISNIDLRVTAIEEVGVGGSGSGDLNMSDNNGLVSIEFYEHATDTSQTYIVQKWQYDNSTDSQVIFKDDFLMFKARNGDIHKFYWTMVDDIEALDSRVTAVESLGVSGYNLVTYNFLRSMEVQDFASGDATDVWLTFKYTTARDDCSLVINDDFIAMFHKNGERESIDWDIQSRVDQIDSSYMSEFDVGHYIENNYIHSMYQCTLEFSYLEGQGEIGWRGISDNKIVWLKVTPFQLLTKVGDIESMYANTETNGRIMDKKIKEATEPLIAKINAQEITVKPLVDKINDQEDTIKDLQDKIEVLLEIVDLIKGSA